MRALKEHNLSEHGIARTIFAVARWMYMLEEAMVEEAPKKAMSRMFTNKCDFNGQRYVWIGACTPTRS
jgi:hypothetical protein